MNKKGVTTKGLYRSLNPVSNTLIFIRNTQYNSNTFIFIRNTKYINAVKLTPLSFEAIFLTLLSFKSIFIKLNASKIKVVKKFIPSRAYFIKQGLI